MVVHICNKEKEIKEIYTVSIQQAEQINNMDSKVTEIHKMLMGNGRPGLLQEVEVMKAERNYFKFILPIIITIIATSMSLVVAVLF